MNRFALRTLASQLVAPGKGLLAMDESTALDIWRGRDENVMSAQKAIHHRALCNSAATLGRYDARMEGVPT